MKKMFKNVEEIRKAFVNDGWSKNTTFTELTLNEAEKEGLLFAIDEIKKGKKYFRMDTSRNIFNSNGEIVFYNIPAKKG